MIILIINILAGGPNELTPNLLDYKEDDSIWVGVDRGALYLLSKGIQPKIAFGDFDSVSDEEFQRITKEVHQLRTFIKEKDETDTELALNWAIQQKPSKVRIFGGTGGRMDHFIANVQLILKTILQNPSCQIEIIDQKNMMYITKPGTHTLKKIRNSKYVSFLPMSDGVKGLTLQGFKYPLKEQDIPLGSTLCISNELIHDKGTFSFSKGILMVIRSCD